jgi:hypothetical protein
MIETLQNISMLITTIMILATIFVRITPTKDDDAKVDSMIVKLQEMMKYLPTFGVNPRTQKLEEALKELQEQNKPKV